MKIKSQQWQCRVINVFIFSSSPPLLSVLLAPVCIYLNHQTQFYCRVFTFYLARNPFNNINSGIYKFPESKQQIYTGER